MEAPAGPEQPDWWTENEELKEYLGLPPYDPPRFEDGTYLHDVVPDLEERFDCDVQLIGVNTEYLDDWEVRLDGTTAFEVGRRRDENGNTIFLTDPDRFCERVEAWYRRGEE